MTATYTRILVSQPYICNAPKPSAYTNCSFIAFTQLTPFLRDVLQLIEVDINLAIECVIR